MAAGRSPARTKVAKGRSFLGSARRFGVGVRRSRLSEDRVEQIVVGKTGEQAIVELAPVALGGAIAVQPHRLLFGFERGRTEGNEIALSGQPAPDFHDEIAQLSGGGVDDESRQSAE